MDRVAPARESEQFKADFSQVSKFDLLFFYLSHPGYYLEKLDVAMAHTGFIRPYYLSNLDATHPRLTFAGRFGGWSWLRGQLPVNTWLAAGAHHGGGLLGPVAGRGGPEGRGQGQALRRPPGAHCAGLHGLPVPDAHGHQRRGGPGQAHVRLRPVHRPAAPLGAGLAGVPAFHGRAGAPPRRRAGGEHRRCASLLLLAVPAGISLIRAQLPHNTLETGAYVQLGAWEGKPLLWQAAEQQEDGTWLLLAAEPVDQRAFDQDGDFGSSRWSDSDLRAWLNGDFLTAAFDQSEREMLGDGQPSGAAVHYGSGPGRLRLQRLLRLPRAGLQRPGHGGWRWPWTAPTPSACPTSA